MTAIRVASALSVLGLAQCLLNAVTVRRPDPRAAASARSVDVLLPVRDEAGQVADCLDALARLRHDGRLRVLVLDDGSTDGTADLLRTRPDITLLTGAPLPPGWTGKAFACAQLAAVADAEVLVFLDADVRLGPDAVAAALALADRTGWRFCSPYPRQEANTWLERLVQPLLQWSWLTTVPLRLAELGVFPSMGVANGQFLVVERAAYVRAGGHAGVRGEVLEDVALARALLRSGARGGVCVGTALASCRMYSGARDLADGYGKSLWTAFGGPVRGLAVCAALGFVYLLPPAAAVRGSRAGLLGLLAAVANRWIAARVSGARTWPDPLAHPLSIAALGTLTVRSIIGRRRGTIRWKGRFLP